MEKSKNIVQLKNNKLPIGITDFGKIIREGYVYVDKSLFIKAIMQAHRVESIVCFKGSGKNTNLSMLQHFFAPKVNGNPTEGLFDNLAIAQQKLNDGKSYLIHQGKYPVLLLDFSNITSDDYDENIRRITAMIAREVGQYKDTLEGNLKDYERRDFDNLLNQNIEPYLLGLHLQLITRILSRYYKKHCILLIDSYDSPFFSIKPAKLAEMQDFMHRLLNPVVKGNGYTERVVLAGTLRFPPDESFMGGSMDNFLPRTIFNFNFDKYFGFTQNEVESLFTGALSDLEQKELKDFAGNYRINKSFVYQPDALFNFFTRAAMKCAISSKNQVDELVINTLVKNEILRKRLNKFIMGKKMNCNIDPYLTVRKFLKIPCYYFLNLLVLVGYASCGERSSKYYWSDEHYTVELPNNNAKEILLSYLQLANTIYEESNIHNDVTTNSFRM